MQEKTGAEDASASTSAVQEVEEAFGVPVVSVVGMSHLTEYMASQEDAAGANAEVSTDEMRWLFCKLSKLLARVMRACASMVPWCVLVILHKTDASTA